MYQDAWDCLEELPRSMRGEPSVVSRRISIYQSMGNWNAAATVAQSMVLLHPEEPCWWLDLAHTIRHMLGPKEAAEVLREGVKLHPLSAKITYDLARHAAMAGEVEEARKWLRKAFSVDAKLKKTAIVEPDLGALY